MKRILLAMILVISLIGIAQAAKPKPHFVPYQPYRPYVNPYYRPYVNPYYRPYYVNPYYRPYYPYAPYVGPRTTVVYLPGYGWVVQVR